MVTILRKMTEDEWKFGLSPEQKTDAAFLEAGKKVELLWKDPYREAILLLGYVIETE